MIKSLLSPYQEFKAQILERPILLSGKLVCETLYGRKTQTRRTSNLKSINENLNEWELIETSHEHNQSGTYFSAFFMNKKNGERNFVRCPFGSKGDFLWVRETWRVGAWDVSTKSIAVDYRADNFARREWIQIFDESRFKKLVEQSIIDSEEEGFSTYGINEGFKWEPGQSPCRWRPSLFMPKEFSRLTLEIKNIRIERLHQISEQDAENEGIQFLREIPDADETLSARDLFEVLWEDRNGRGSWKKNPWVWVIEYQTWEDELPY
ncbi:hypothetical protein [Leptospira kirschneri]|uniref:Uncharacterized protein n=1 Tax=Leptospira kirschneri serovar Bulgarica str. Nikolaevo TaxID=1240687 RepID=M6F8U5_9LEPT|nr:hypothetical protein [Leptospira kirschneri]EMK22419.1 hypothetical protein LEP1GSC008_1554 [Leptospira kirschneri serovar Bulgarica str. Nikolaevo]EMK24494.1 hypothetical protein LEP1GSC008_2627 [Leptospira kirschneri serovar Bulgarica str. Nikolaevo]EMK24864.1 hypothetical protein LEP1GSC008_0603 [Leptospira kirschneri serovar Bulgarica str. Nikolaevo]